VDTRSGIAQLVSSFLPATQYVQMTRGIFLKALGIPDLLTQGLYLAALGAVPTLISLWMFKKQVD
jgi:ribosome-dependent ATPase